MCEPTTIIAGISAATSLAGSVGAAQSAQSQLDSIPGQVNLERQARDFEAAERRRAIGQEAHDAELERREAVGRTKSSLARLGIGGTSAQDVVSAESDVGATNVARHQRSIDKVNQGRHLADKISTSNAQNQANSIAANAPGLFDHILAGAQGGLQGYATGIGLKRDLNPINTG